MVRKICMAEVFIGAVIIVLLALPQGVTAQSYQFFSLDAPGSTDTEPYGVNASGLIGGTYYDASGNPHAFDWQQGVFTTLDVPNGGGFSSGSAPNAQGQIALSYGGATTTDGAVYQQGVFTLLNNTTGYSQLGPTTINDAGYIGGIVANDPSYSDARGFVFDGTTFNYYAYPGATWTYIWGLNDTNAIVGTYQDAAGDLHGYEENGGSYTSIDYPGALSTTALGISDDGTVVGRYKLGSNRHGYLLNGNIFTSFDFPGATDTILTDLNSATGELTGYYSTDNLNTIHGFYALAVPEPSCVALLIGMGLTGAGLLARHRKILSNP